ncbi:MAG: helix-turn-helix domain-containing protein [Candidatus Competibacteraceae bacterium]|nr:helix-turn-helix domain-containing protein [Candidatus Competibacteraceae bacterium]
MIINDFKTSEICSLLDVSDSFVSKWKTIYENEGAEGLRLKYKGGTGFLTEAQRFEIFFFVEEQTLL